MYEGMILQDAGAENECPNSTNATAFQSANNWKTEVDAPKWELVSREVLESEKCYANYLRLLVNDFQPSLKAILCSNDVRAIFLNVGQLFALSEQFCNELEPAVKSGKVGHLYQQLCPYFKMYAEYSRHHGAAIGLVEKLCKSNKDFCTVVEELESKTGRSLLSLLIMPVQRIPRHVLLLGELVSSLPKGHHDRSACCDALSHMRTVADAVNNTIAEKESRVKVWEIQQSLRYPKVRARPQRNSKGGSDDSSDECEFSGTLDDNDQSLFFSLSRRFIKEGDLHLVCERKKQRKRRVFLFNDCLVYARPAPHSILRDLRHSKRWLFCEKITPHNVVSLENGSPLALGGENAFIVETSDRSIVWLAESPSSKEKWVSTIRANLVGHQTKFASLATSKITTKATTSASWISFSNGELCYRYLSSLIVSLYAFLCPCFEYITILTLRAAMFGIERIFDTIGLSRQSRSYLALAAKLTLGLLLVAFEKGQQGCLKICEMINGMPPAKELPAVASIKLKIVLGQLFFEIQQLFTLQNITHGIHLVVKLLLWALLTFVKAVPKAYEQMNYMLTHFFSESSSQRPSQGGDGQTDGIKSKSRFKFFKAQRKKQEGNVTKTA